jgi:hypothetical protein
MNLDLAVAAAFLSATNAVLAEQVTDWCMKSTAR